ncbi:MAG TPA: alpha/beta fold hydrolase [Chloroflexota bacterium]|nr:alpha/beta fold hydrolase [Chloroflexota bacterium]
MKKSKKAILMLLALLAVLLLVSIGFVAWAGDAADPMPEAIATLTTDAQVTVNQDEWITFTPTGAQPDSGLIIYPGGRVDPRAYAPIAHAIASQGYQVVIVPMPLNLAFFDANAASDVITAYPEIRQWAIAGHSLGGAMAAQYAYNHPDQVDGLVLWAAYPAQNANLSGYDLDVVSVYGTEDGLASIADIENAKNLLPTDVQWWPITGGNHAQFGWYGDQSGDNPATIDRATQQAQIIEATLNLLNNLKPQ